ncbi:MAG TPA: selenide, water dikinase SelD [Rhodoblastus sp.]|nr:selenide, water dikinase SelD [Rhodoblastus sp.]
MNIAAGAAAPNFFRLTDLAHGGGCGCKLAPAVLQRLLAGTPSGGFFPNLLVGAETADDAAVYRLDDERALIATTDFFMPIVDDPNDFGRIAATNALSDVYAMGGRPILALSLLGMPLGKIPEEAVRAILSGGAAVCAEAGAPVAGGHSIDSAEPIYGLVAIGLANPRRILRNSTARPGDVLILTKGLGVGIFSAALKKGVLSGEDYRTMIASTTRRNDIGPELATLDYVHAATDVTGFGLLGHLLEMCRGAQLRAVLSLAALPLLPGACALAEAGIVTGASRRNWESYGDEVVLPEDLPEWRRHLLCDPQTSGGLLVAVAPEGVEDVLRRCRAAGFDQSAIIGRMEAGAAQAFVFP